MKLKKNLFSKSNVNSTQVIHVQFISTSFKVVFFLLLQALFQAMYAFFHGQQVWHANFGWHTLSLYLHLSLSVTSQSNRN